MSSPVIRLALPLQQLGPQDRKSLKNEFLQFLEHGEYNQLAFGKNSAFSRPKSAVEEELCHVHMIPVMKQQELDIWLNKYATQSRKTSSKILIYTKGYNKPESYLLIDILDEPDGHNIMDSDETLIGAYADIARRYHDAY